MRPRIKKIIVIIKIINIYIASMFIISIIYHITVKYKNRSRQEAVFAEQNYYSIFYNGQTVTLAGNAVASFEAPAESTHQPEPAVIGTFKDTIAAHSVSMS